MHVFDWHEQRRNKTESLHESTSAQASTQKKMWLLVVNGSCAAREAKEAEKDRINRYVCV